FCIGQPPPRRDPPPYHVVLGPHAPELDIISKSTLGCTVLTVMCVGWVPFDVERVAVHAYGSAVSTRVVCPLLVVARLTKAVELPRTELADVTTMRLDVVSDRGRRTTTLC